mmetsp:Transcript_13235/g.49089  ORF Transcript_13235/g.49089 Transcript_13235/m.49089 type:complete len:242 (-) Transcript_13235:12-737(-)
MPPVASLRGTLRSTSRAVTPGLELECMVTLLVLVHPAMASATLPSLDAFLFLRPARSSSNFSWSRWDSASSIPSTALPLECAAVLASPAISTAAAAAVFCCVASSARSSSRSRTSRAITRHAASCWYKASLSSLRVSSRCCLSVSVSSMTLSHSLRRDSRRFGNELALGGLGGAPPDAATAIKSASVRGVLVTGHKLDVRRCARIVRFSNSCPVVLDTTGSLGTSPLMAQNMAFGAFGAKS